MIAVNMTHSMMGPDGHLKNVTIEIHFLMYVILVECIQNPKSLDPARLTLSAMKVVTLDGRDITGGATGVGENKVLPGSSVNLLSLMHGLAEQFVFDIMASQQDAVKKTGEGAPEEGPKLVME